MDLRAFTLMNSLAEITILINHNRMAYQQPSPQTHIKINKEKMEQQMFKQIRVRKAGGCLKRYNRKPIGKERNKNKTGDKLFHPENRKRQHLEINNWKKEKWKWQMFEMCRVQSSPGATSELNKKPIWGKQFFSTRKQQEWMTVLREDRQWPMACRRCHRRPSGTCCCASEACGSTPGCRCGGSAASRSGSSSGSR